jgi:hypothetical protein
MEGKDYPWKTSKGSDFWFWQTCAVSWIYLTNSVPFCFVHCSKNSLLHAISQALAMYWVKIYGVF